MTLAVLRLHPGSAEEFGSMVSGSSPPWRSSSVRAQATRLRRLVAKEAGGVDLTAAAPPGRRRRLRGGTGIAPEQPRRDRVDPFVGALCRQDGRHQQLPGVAVAQRARRVAGTRAAAPRGLRPPVLAVACTCPPSLKRGHRGYRPLRRQLRNISTADRHSRRNKYQFAANPRSHVRPTRPGPAEPNGRPASGGRHQSNAEPSAVARAQPGCPRPWRRRVMSRDVARVGTSNAAAMDRVEMPEAGAAVPT